MNIYKLNSPIRLTCNIQSHSIPHNRSSFENITVEDITALNSIGYSIDFVEQIKRVHKSRLASFDVTNLYTDVTITDSTNLTKIPNLIKLNSLLHVLFNCRTQ